MTNHKELLELVGRDDKEDTIYLSVVKGIDRHNPTHYRGCFTQNRDTLILEPGRQYVSMSRMVTVPAAGHDHIDTFLAEFRRCGHYWLAPAFADESGVGQIHRELAILKRKFTVVEAWQVGPHDEDAMAILTRDEVFVPDDVTEAPIEDLRKWRAETLDARAVSTKPSASGRR